MSYTIVFEKSVEKHVARLSSAALTSIRHAIDSRLTTHPIQFGKPLRLSLKGHRRLRVGNYRVIYRVDETQKMVYVVAIGNRKDVYGD